MSKIPTAEDLFEKYSNLCQFEEGLNEYMMDKEDFKEAYMEGVKLHVEAALKEANAKAKNCHIDEIINNEILNAYPLENIK
jgi:hypothetical protein